MVATPARSLGRWSRSKRPTAELVRDYDWDGAIAPGGARIDALLTDADFDAIADGFWRYYAALPGAAAIRHWFTEEQIAQQSAYSRDYLRTKYRDPLGERWRGLAQANADWTRDAGVSLQTLLAAFARAHSLTSERVAARAADRAEARRLGEVIARLALVEADVMATHLGAADAARAGEERRARAEAFREQIATAIAGAAARGAQIR